MECIIFMGLPASGKTSFYRARFADTHRLVSKDEMRNVRDRARRQQELVSEAFAGGHSVVIDNTHPSPVDRAPIIAQARAGGAQVIGYFFETTTREAVARNRGREGRARVPPVAIFAIAKRLQAPSVSEGFDRLFRVRLTETGEFVVSDWPPLGIGV